MDRVDQAGHGTGRLAMDFLETLPIALPSNTQQRRIVAALEAAGREIEILNSLASNRVLKKSVLGLG